MSGRGRPAKNKLNFRENFVHAPNQTRLNLKRSNNTDIFDGPSTSLPAENQLVLASSQVAKIPTGSKKILSNDELLRSIKDDTASTRLEVADTRRELKGDINRLTQRTDAKFKSIEDRLVATDNDIKTLFSRIRAIESASPSASIDFELQKQNRLRNNISIANVPIEERENLFDIFTQLMEFIGCSRIDVNEVADAKRVRNSKSNLIIVSLVDERRKLEIMKKKIGVKIMAADIFNLGEGDANPRIYINAQLTPFYSHLAYLGRSAVASNRIYSSFVTQYGFFVKLDEKSHPTPIANKAQLDQFLANNHCLQQRNNNKRTNRTFDDSDTSPSTFRPSKQTHTEDTENVALSNATPAASFALSNATAAIPSILPNATAATPFPVIPIETVEKMDVVVGGGGGAGTASQ